MVKRLNRFIRDTTLAISTVYVVGLPGEVSALEKGSHVLETKSLAVSLDDQGRKVGLTDKDTDRNYLLTDPPKPARLHNN